MVFLVAIGIVIDPRFISDDISSYEVPDYRLAGVIICVGTVLVMLIKVWFFKTVDACYKYMNRMNRDRTVA
uniref:Neur_chan_memb domain-containing protein n=1 Tax=Steinernema glaseri TaxID=37863 RepID=A0A1I8AWN9_9BILA